MFPFLGQSLRFCSEVVLRVAPDVNVILQVIDYPGLPHGMCTTHPEVVNADLLSFVKSNQKSAAAG